MEGHLEEAEKLQRETLEKERRVLGPENRHTIISMDTLAAILGEEGRLAESERLEAQAIDLERRVFGPDELGVLMSMGNLADTLYLMGKYSEAKQQLEQNLDLQRRVLDPNHPETARTLYNLGCLAARESKRDEAFSFLLPAIDHLSLRFVPKVDNDPDLNSLHEDPRFAKLVARAKQRGVSDAKCPL
jgi:tetratricopeptide (TPR) repeat protein